MRLHSSAPSVIREKNIVQQAHRRAVYAVEHETRRHGSYRRPAYHQNKNRERLDRPEGQGKSHNREHDARDKTPRARKNLLRMKRVDLAVHLDKPQAVYVDRQMHIERLKRAFVLSFDRDNVRNKFGIEARG